TSHDVRIDLAYQTAYMLLTAEFRDRVERLRLGWLIFMGRHVGGAVYPRTARIDEALHVTGLHRIDELGRAPVIYLFISVGVGIGKRSGHLCRQVIDNIYPFQRFLQGTRIKQFAFDELDLLMILQTKSEKQIIIQSA